MQNTVIKLDPHAVERPPMLTIRAARQGDLQQILDMIALHAECHGDTAKIKAIISTLEDHLGFKLSDVPIAVQDSGDKVALSTGGYGSTLLKNGDLGSKGGFRDAVPQADKASAVLYVDFDSPWRTLLVQAVTDGEGGRQAAELQDNTEPLRSLGLSAWQDGSVTHGLLKITTD